MTLDCLGVFSLKVMAGGESQLPRSLDLADKSSFQAHFDWFGSILLPCLGDLVEALSKQQTR